MPRALPAVAVVVLVAAGPAAAATDGTVIPIHNGLATVTIPFGWYEIDRDHLDELALFTADATAGRVAESFAHGFRPMLPTDQPGLPQITVQIRDTGRLRYGNYLDLPGPGDDVDGPFNRFENGVPPLVTGVSVERVWFDRDSLALRLEHALDLRHRGRARVLTAALLTERGFIAFHYIDRERRMDDGRALFDEVVGSVVIDPSIAYRPRWSDRWPGLPFFAAAGVVAAALAVLLVARSRRGS